MNTALYWQSPYLRTLATAIIKTQEADGKIWAALAETIFYPRSGGQPGDKGTFCIDGKNIAVLDTIADRQNSIIWHQLSAEPPPLGTPVTATLDWAHRYANMRTHTAMHLLCTAVNAPVTGGSISPLRGRIDFDSGDAPDKTMIETKMNEWIRADAPVSARWVEEEELDRNPTLIKTMSVSPPRGAGKIRLVEIANIDRQACGGTHVARTGEIGVAQVIKVENKGRANRRVIFVLSDCG